MRSFSRFVLLALPLVGGVLGDQGGSPTQNNDNDKSLYANANEAFQDLLNALPEESLRVALKSTLVKFKEGVFESDRRGVEHVHHDDPPLATKLIVAAVQDLKQKRQEPAPTNGTSTPTDSPQSEQPPEETEAPPTSDSPPPAESTEAPPPAESSEAPPPPPEETSAAPPPPEETSDTPSQPEETDEPSQPEETDEPSQPEETDEPSQPEETDEPSQPEETDEPSQPEENDEPSQPEENDEPSQPEETDEAPNTPDSSAVLVPVPVETTDSEGQRTTVSSEIYSEPTASVAVPVTRTNDRGETTVITETKPAVVASTTDDQGRPSEVTSAVDFAPTPGEVRTNTDERGSTVLTTYTPGGGRVSSIKLLTTTGANGEPTVVTSYTYVEPQAATASDTPTRTNGDPSVQTNGAANINHMPDALIYGGALGGALALFV